MVEIKKRPRLSEIAESINKEAGEMVAQFGLGELAEAKRVPFTSPRLNYETYGGIPMGTVVQFVGRESSGKTTTALDAVKNFQKEFEREFDEEIEKYETLIASKKASKEDKEKYDRLLERGKRKVCYLNYENTMDKVWALRLGVDDSEDAIFYRTPTEDLTAEKAFDEAIKIAETGEVGLIVLDSIVSLLSEQVIGESVGKAKVCGNAALVTRFLRKLIPICRALNITVIIINQVIANIKNPYADFEMPGGQGLRHYSDVILVFKKGEFIDDTGELKGKNAESPSGNIVQVHVQKTKVFKPDRRIGFYSLTYDYGVDLVLDVFDLAVEFNAIEKSGGWYTLLNPKTKEPIIGNDGKPLKFQGKGNVIQYLRLYPSIANVFVNYVNELIEQSAVQIKVRETAEGDVIIRNEQEQTEEQAEEKQVEETVDTTEEKPVKGKGKKK